MVNEPPGITDVKGRSGDPRVALTFDAEHPSRPHHGVRAIEEILGVLALRSVQATFFIQGRWASTNPRTAKRIAEEGHTIGSHSNAHVAMTRLSEEGLAQEVIEAQERIQETTGVDPRPYFRCPYGDGHQDDRVIQTLSRLGYRAVGWDIDPQDWNHERSKDALVSFMNEALSQAWDSPPIVLLHTWPSTTPGALAAMLEHGAELGLAWVPIDEASGG